MLQREPVAPCGGHRRENNSVSGSWHDDQFASSAASLREHIAQGIVSAARSVRQRVPLRHHWSHLQNPLIPLQYIHYQKILREKLRLHVPLSVQYIYYVSLMKLLSKQPTYIIKYSYIPLTQPFLLEPAVTAAIACAKSLSGANQINRPSTDASFIIKLAGKNFTLRVAFMNTISYNRLKKNKFFPKIYINI